MRSLPGTLASGLLALAFVAFCAATPALADDARVVSARAGGVNFVSGKVLFRRSGSNSWQWLTTKDELREGYAVRTSDGALAEILLSPGSYLRLGANSELEMTNTAPDRLRVNLRSGSAVVEATGYDELRVLITVETPRAPVFILRAGVYRVNVPGEDTTEVLVRKGRAEVRGEQVKGERVARVGASGVEIAKLDKKDEDAFDLWSRERARDLARANSQLRSRQVKALLAGVSFDDPFYVRRLSGVWIFTPLRDCYTFMPFYYGWSSPYGYGYGWVPGFSSLAWCPCGRFYNNWPNNTGWTGGGQISTGTGTGAGTGTLGPPTPTTFVPNVSKGDFTGSGIGKDPGPIKPPGGKTKDQ